MEHHSKTTMDVLRILETMVKNKRPPNDNKTTQTEDLMDVAVEENEESDDEQCLMLATEYCFDGQQGLTRHFRDDEDDYGPNGSGRGISV